MFAVTGHGPFAIKYVPSSLAPVPQSKMKRTPEPVSTSTHEVLPPYRIVDGPGVAIDPRVPQKRSRKSLLPPTDKPACQAPLSCNQGERVWHRLLTAYLLYSNRTAWR